MDGDDSVSDTKTDDHSLERLDPQEIGSGSLLALTHLQRYELARGLVEGRRVVDLCCGVGYGSLMLAETAADVVGVDVDADAIGAANRLADDRDRVRFAIGDALEHVRALPQADDLAVVCFEGVEHVPDPDALADALSRLVQGGSRVIVSLPNSAGFEEHNAFHATDFGYEEAMLLFARIGDPTLVVQRLAEGSVLAPAVRSHDGAVLTGDAEVHADPDDRPEWANHWIAAYNIDGAAVATASARFRVSAGNHHNAYMRSLERANAELLAANHRMARAWLGIHDAAAAAQLARYQRRAEEAQRRAEEAERRLETEVEVAFQNDRNFQVLRRQLQSPRYRLVDAIYHRVLGVPGVSTLFRLLSAKGR